MNQVRRVLTPAETQKPFSFSDRLYQRLNDALQAGTEVNLRLTWGNLRGIPIYLDPTCVEIVFVHVCVDDDDGADEEVSWRTVWLVRLAEVTAIAYLTESWSKERLEQLLPPKDKSAEADNIETDSME